MTGRAAAFSRMAGLAVAAVGAAVLAGWITGSLALKSLFVEPPVTVKANASLGLIAGGLAVWLLSTHPRPGARTVTGRALAAFMLALGAATLSQHVFGWDLGIDQLLFSERGGELATASPNRMGPPASSSLMLLGAGLLLLDRRSRRASLVRQAMLLAVVVITLFGLTGYLTGVTPLFLVARVTGISPATGLSLLLLALAVLAARPQHGIMGLLVDRGEAGRLARRLMVPALLLPLLAAAVLRFGVRAGWLDDHFAQAALALFVTVSAAAVIWTTAAGLARALQARDIAEAERARREEALREANRRQTDFLAVLSHELRNPLAPMRYALDLMPGGGAPRAVVERQLAHLVHLVDDLLDVGRITTGKIRLRRRPIDVAEVLTHAVEAARPELERARHQLTLQHGGRGSLWVDGDPDRLAQVLTNLLNNAARYTPPGGRVTVSARAEGDEVVVRVADTGIGLDAPDLERVFEMFSQVGTAQGGLGIGLALVRAIVELHGGRVEAHSEGAGRGAEFRVRLPRTAAPADVVSAPAALVSGAARRVVVADDNADSADMMRALLEMDGHRVQVASNGPDALEMITSFAPDVAVLDIGMPGLDGYEVARRVRAEGRPVYLIAVTGWGQDVDRRRAEQAGFNAHFTKPANPDDLRRIVANP